MHIFYKFYCRITHKSFGMNTKMFRDVKFFRLILVLPPPQSKQKKVNHSEYYQIMIVDIIDRSIEGINKFAIAIQFIAKPIEITASSTFALLLHFEYKQICL